MAGARLWGTHRNRRKLLPSEVLHCGWGNRTYALKENEITKQEVNDNAKQ